MFQRPPPQPRPRSKASFSTFLRWIVGMYRRPRRVLMDVTYEAPLLRSLALLGVIYLTLGASLLAIGDNGFVSLGSGTVEERLSRGAQAFLAVSAALFAHLAAAHWLAKALEGEGSFSGMIAGGIFSLVPLLLFGVLTLILAVPPFPSGVARVVQGLGFAIAVGWSAVLYGKAVRENHAFTDIQAYMSLLVPPVVVTIGGGLLVVMGYMVVILFL